MNHKNKNLICASRSSSESIHRKDIKDKKYKKDKKQSSKRHSKKSHSKSRSRSRSYDSRSISKSRQKHHRSPNRSRSNSKRKHNKHKSVRKSSSSEERQFQKEKAERQIQKEEIKKRRELLKHAIKPSVNRWALAGIIRETKNRNQTLDNEELKSANEKFKKLDHSERQATLLSQHINDTSHNRDEYILQYQDGQYVKVYKQYVCTIKNCQMRFQYSTELQKHLELHQKEQQRINDKFADNFTTELTKGLFD